MIKEFAIKAVTTVKTYAKKIWQVFKPIVKNLVGSSGFYAAKAASDIRKLIKKMKEADLVPSKNLVVAVIDGAASIGGASIMAVVSRFVDSLYARSLPQHKIYFILRQVAWVGLGTMVGKVASQGLFESLKDFYPVKDLFNSLADLYDRYDESMSKEAR